MDEPIIISTKYSTTLLTPTFDGWIETRTRVIHIAQLTLVADVETWLEVSGRMFREGAENCMRCNHKFVSGDTVWKAYSEDGAAPWVCSKCAEELIKEGGVDDG